MFTIFIASAIAFLVAGLGMSLNLIIRKRALQKKCAGCGACPSKDAVE